MAATELFDALNTSVSFLFGESVISPGALPAEWVAGAQLRPSQRLLGNRPALAKTDDTSCETKARTGRPVVVVVRVEGARYPLQDTHTLVEKNTRAAVKACFKPGTSELQAGWRFRCEKRIIAEQFSLIRKRRGWC